MKVYSQLVSAALEVKSSDYSVGITGLIWWNSTSKQVKIGDTTSAITNFLLNNEACVFGRSGTAADNIRFHRGAAGVLQLVTGSDTTTEGTLSTSLNQLSARAENYTDAGKPSAANAGRIAYITDLGVLKYDTGSAWMTLASNAASDKIDAIYDAIVGSAAQVTANVATHSTLAAAIAAVSAGDQILLLDVTTTENITLAKKVTIVGKGEASVLDGTLQLSSGAGLSVIKNLKVTGNITIDSGVNNVNLSEIFVSAGVVISDSGTGNWVFAFEEA